MSLQEPLYDYAFIGMGCANSLILMELHRAGLLENKKLIVYEPESKKGNDRTFCFWLTPTALKEAGLDKLVSHSWSKVKCNEEQPQFLAAKRYYYLRAEALYAHASQLLSQHEVTFHLALLKDYPKSLAHVVFDSRPPQFELAAPNEVQINQSFYGWLVKTAQPIFDPEVFTMMDFSIPQNGHTQFLYVLPFDAQHALIEPTRFGATIMSEEEAAIILENFLNRYATNYQILESESGCIPMCSAAFQQELLAPNWYRTGAGGGQLKPSTGYSFVRSLTDAQEMVKSISFNVAQLKRRKSPNRFAYYDRLLLRIIAQQPEKGKQIFTKLFRQNKAANVLTFLDEKSTLFQEIRLMSTLPILLFLKVALLDALGKCSIFLEKRSVAFYMTIVLLGCSQFQLGMLSNLILVVGLLTIGLPHGALDHLSSVPKTFSVPWKFMGIYLCLGLMVLLVWYFLPYLALLLFLAYTAWHFGQADFEIWNLPSGLKSCFWGVVVIGLILGSHWVETSLILTEMGILLPKSIDILGSLNESSSWVLLFLVLFIFPINRMNSRLKETLFYILIGAWLPLLPAFACYFVFQHSLHGWQHLRHQLKLSNQNMWIQALPFTLGALLLFGAYLYLIQEPNWGQVFIFLSALSFPHVFYMHKRYQKPTRAIY